MSELEVLYETRDNAAWITLNRAPQRNPLNFQMIDLIFQYLDKAENDDEIRVVCFTGAGQKMFCSGMDIKAALAAGDPTGGSKRYTELMKKLHNYSKPLVAKLNGHCLGGGLGLMLSCDIIYARDGIKIGTPEVNVGVFPLIVSALILRNCIRNKALEMIYSARLLEVDEAETIGLINSHFPKENFNDAVKELLNVIASKGPSGIRIGRQALAAIENMDFFDSLDYLCDKLTEVVKTEDAAEGMLAFIEKRKPVWKNR